MSAGFRFGELEMSQELALLHDARQVHSANVDLLHARLMHRCPRGSTHAHALVRESADQVVLVGVGWRVGTVALVDGGDARGVVSAVHDNTCGPARGE